ncbi:Ig-like domain-containing protein [Lysobacter sp. 5GHs7-4]|uniref:colicin D domain-containing protein n=1 Tax=Lysobacter sp. 5GHs7-4 TaxID=2904253 RepID=UPI001E2916A5|nr:colicin D domain-containing protein [Lysobacter sp. 5GHs7-4]UHQ23252.1 Ig-like domain-containing protein [Lysobacter sp. 5GHs7-4]
MSRYDRREIDSSFKDRTCQSKPANFLRRLKLTHQGARMLVARTFLMLLLLFVGMGIAQANGPWIRIASPANGASFPAPGNVTISVEVGSTDPALTVDDIFVQVNDEPVQNNSQLQNLAPGTYNVYAFANVYNGGVVEPDPVEVVGQFVITAAPARNAQFVSQSVPIAMAAGQSYAVTVQMKNIGTATWTSGGAYKLGSRNPVNGDTWSLTRVAVPGDVAPGQTASFTFTTRAPTAPGTYNFQWGMLQEGVESFGEASSNLSIAVTSGSISATPNPCAIPSGGAVCTSSITWSSSANDAEVWVTGLDNANPQLFARAKSGTQSASWINAVGKRFHLKSGALTTATIDVAGQFAANVAPSVHLTAPVGGQVFPAGSTVTLKASASDPDNGIQRVEFYVDGVKVGEDASAPYSVGWISTAGPHSLAAVAIDPLNAQTTSTAVGITVSSPPSVVTGGVGRYYVYNNDPAYGADQRLCKIIEPETGATVMRYDSAGNLMWSASGLNLPSTTSCDYAAAHASGRRSDRLYDARNRVTDLSFPDGNGNQHWGYTPDGLPHQLRTWNDAGTTVVDTVYAYNKRRLLAKESLLRPYEWAIGYGYDQNGSLAAQTYPTGLALTYAPNALGQATQVGTAPNSTTSGTYASGVGYYPNGAIKQFTYGNGIVHTMLQNARQLPQTTQDGSVLGFTNLYDENGNTTLIDDLVQGQNFKRYLSYDGLDRLTAAGSAMFGGTTHYINYTYDALDNIRTVSHPGVREHTYWYDASNRLTNVQATAGGATVIGLGYDVQGNQTNKNGQEYNFDYGNRLRRVTGKERYRYDSLGRRSDVLYEDGSVHVFQYSQAGLPLFSSKVSAAAVQTTHENIYLAGSLIATVDHNWPSNTVIATKYHHTDALGSPVAVTDTSGAVIERTNYEPYGSPINKTVNGIGYTGHVMDGMTGLTYMQQRYYDPSIGRFLSADPVLAYPDSGGNFNRYRYVNNNPYGFYDPDGRQSVKSAYIRLRANVINFARGMGKETFDAVAEDAFTSTPNPMAIPAYPGEFSFAEQCGCAYNSPFSATSNNEEQLGRDMAPAAAVLLALSGKRGAVSGPRIMRSVGSAVNRGMSFSRARLQAKFKHASDFGVNGAWNREAGASFEQALRNHIDADGTLVIQGTYRWANDVTHFYNPSTGLNVIRDADMNFVSGWRLSPRQQADIMENGNVY